MDEALLRSAALATIENAEDLLSDARLLLEHRRFARAVSLSVLGQEEMGKAVLYTLAALDVVEGLRDALPLKSRKNPVASHAAKQVSIELAGVSAWLSDEYDGILASEAPAEAGYDPVLWYITFIQGCAEEARQQLADPERARRYHEGIKVMLNEVPAFSRRLPPSRTPEERKWAGFYVDLDGGSVTRPREISRADARSALIDLEADLETVTRLRDLLQDEPMWSELGERLRGT